jgi:hypothetical protein
MDANRKEHPLSPELDAELRTRYPLIFSVEPLAAPDDPDMPASPSTLATWGFECGDGWYELIDALCLNLQHATKDGAPQVVATQVKEKYGALSFCTQGVNDEQDGMIALAETMSARLCDVCGNRGRLIRAGWVRCRCPQHETI